MNTSGEAADQIVRMSLEVGEAALKISGAGAKQLAVILYAMLKEQKKTRGRARLETLVRSGRPLRVFSVRESDLKKFVKEAKRYGILYSAIRHPKGKGDGMVDIMVKEEDAPRINRIVERFRFASVTEAAQVRTEIERSREERQAGEKAAGKEPEPAQKTEEKNGMEEHGWEVEREEPGEEKETGAPEKRPAGRPKTKEVPDRERPEKSRERQLAEELLAKPVKKEESERQNPSLAETEKSPPSEPTSKKQERAAGGTFKPGRPERKSVRKELEEIKQARKNEAADKTKEDRRKSPAHKQPKKKKKRNRNRVKVR